MPMGLKKCRFQRMMDKVLDWLIGETCFVYLDDIIIFWEDVETHEERVRQYSRGSKPMAYKSNWKNASSSCHQFVSWVFISHGQVEKSQHLVDAIATAELPKTMCQLRGFSGIANYYRKFIKKLKLWWYWLRGILINSLWYLIWI